MKKILAVMLALMLALSGVSCLAATGDALLGKSETGDSDVYYYAACTDGDTLYLISYDGISTYHIGDGDVVKYEWAEENADEDISVNRSVLFVSEGRLLSVQLYMHYGDHTEFQKAALCEVTLDEDAHTASSQELMPLDWDGKIEYWDNDAYPRTPEAVCAVDGAALMRFYDDSDTIVVQSLDLSTGRWSDVDGIENAYAMTAYRDGAVLVECFTYDQPEKVSFVVYDPASDSVQPMSECQVSAYNPLQGLAWDGGTDQVYCVKEGEICPLDLTTGQVGEGVADMPMEIYGGQQAACVMNGGYYVLCSNGVAVRNLDPAQRAETKLKVYDSQYTDAVNRANYLFSNARGDVSVAISRDYSNLEHVVENMMNRDNSVDIYILSTTGTEYDALYKRGYMMELDGCEHIDALMEAMYPGLRESFLYNGHVVAVPVQAYSWTLAVNPKALEKLGLTVEDVPNNWWDFLDFLNEIAPKLSQTEGMTLYYQGMTVNDLKSELFYRIFNDYQRYVSEDENAAMGFNSDLMRGLIQKLDTLDYEGLGMLPDEELDGDERSYYSDGATLQLMETTVGCTFGNFYSEFEPLLMGLDRDHPCTLSLEVAVAFVNPFTREPQAAMDFMDELAKDLPEALRYCLIPDLNEPIRNPSYDDDIQRLQGEIEKLQERVENADEADRQALEEELRYSQEILDNYEIYGWTVSQREIDWYRAHDEGVHTSPVNWLYSSEAGGEAYELMSQYLAGQIDAATMLSGIDKKVQMMRMEGN